MDIVNEEKSPKSNKINDENILEEDSTGSLSDDSFEEDLSDEDYDPNVDEFEEIDYQQFYQNWKNRNVEKSQSYHHP